MQTEIFGLYPSIYFGVALAGAQILAQKFVLTKLGSTLGVIGKVGSTKKCSTRELKTLAKFNTSAWSLLSYFCLFLYAAVILVQKPWFWNTQDYWLDYPFQKIDADIKVYYLAEMSLYVSLLLTQFMGAKRKDFWAMVLHHTVCLALGVLSWGINATRIMPVIVCCHDFADIPMEVTKIAIYLKWERLSRYSFLFFTATWIVTRLGIFPFLLISSALDAYKQESMASGGLLAMILLLVVLLVLHVFWTYFILQMLIKSYIPKSEMKDSRSSDEEEETIDIKQKET